MTCLYSDRDDRNDFTMESENKSIAYGDAHLFAIIRFTSRTGPLTKIFDRTADSFEVKACASMYNGYAEVVTLSSLSALPQFISSLTSKQAIGLGGNLRKSLAAIANKIEICTKKHPRPGAITRTRNYFDWAHGAQLICLDYDPPAGARALTPQEIRKKLIQYHRSFAAVGMVILGSVSAGVRCVEDPETGERRGGLHIYLVLTRGSDVDTLKEALAALSWLNGDGFVKVSASGALLPRCLFDLSVFDPSRLFFEAEPIVGPGLIKPEREVVVFDGDMLDMQELSMPSAAELERVRNMIESAKQVQAEAAGIQRKTHLKKVEAELIGKGVPSKVAREQIKRLQDGAIYPGHTLILE
jgi:hypothetical protein